MEPVLIDNGKTLEEPYNAAHGFWLPPDSPYGNLQLKLLKVRQRIDEANRRLRDSFEYWSRIDTRDTDSENAIERHIHANEQAVYMMKRAADELIALTWCLAAWENTGAYPREIKVDCIGAVLYGNNSCAPEYCDAHTLVLKFLNEISNAFKHSFVNSDLNMIGKDEPRVYALALNRNKIESGTELYEILLSYFVEDYSRFYRSGVEWLEAFSERHR